MKRFSVCVLILFVACACRTERPSWRSEFDARLPLLGHRNWILVVDKAYPLQSAAGISCINSGRPLMEVAAEVLSALDSAPHVRPIVYTDRELDAMPSIAPEARKLVDDYNQLLSGRQWRTLSHNEVFAKLDSASRLFKVLVIKTESTIAYSSVFIELDCRYWDAAREAQFRKLIKP